MESPRRLIADTNKDYAALIRGSLKGDPLLTSPSRGPTFANEVVANVHRDTGLVVPSPHGNLNQFQYKLIRISEDISKFWRDRQKDYVDAILQLSCFKVVVSDRKETSLLSMFFDTVLQGDECGALTIISKSPNVDEARLKSASILEAIALNGMHSRLPLLEADTDFPLITVIPSEKALLTSDTEFSREALERAESNYLDFLTEVSKPPFVGPSSSLEWDHLGNSDWVDLSEFFETSQIVNFLQVDEATLSEYSVIFEEYELLKNSSVVSGGAYRRLLRLLHGMFLEMAFQDCLAAEMAADPHVALTNPFSVKSRIEAGRLCKLADLTEETLVSSSLSLPAFDWIRNVTVEDIVTFREQGGLELLRSMFREQRLKIKHASLEDLDSLVEEANNTLTRVVDEHKREIEVEKRAYFKRFGLASVTMAASVSLGITAALYPSLSVVGLPATAWSGIVGAGSARELFNLVTTRRKKIKELADRPIGVFVKYRESASSHT